MTWPLVMCSRDKVKYHSAIFKKATITKYGEETYQNEKLPCLHFTWCNHVITWHLRTSQRNFQEVYNCQIWWKWPNHAKVIKATIFKFALMKGTHPYRPRKLWLCGIPINGEHNVTNFKKAFRYQIWKTKKKKKTV